MNFVNIFSPIKENEKHKKNILYISILLLLLAGYNLFLCNKFFPVTEGWFSEYAMYILDGQIMYKDFFMYIPPLYPLIIAFLIKIFGNYYLVLRIYGIVERLILVLIVWLILKHYFSNKSCFISILIASILYMTNLQDLFYGYYQTSLLIAMFSLLFFINSNNIEFSNRKRFFFASLSGISVGILLYCKHTLGLICFLLYLALFIFYIIMNKNDRSLKYLIIYAFSFCLVVIIGIIILQSLGALNPMIDQLFFSSNSKGSLWNILLNFIVNAKEYLNFIIISLIVGIYCVFSNFLLKNKFNNRYKLLLDIIIYTLFDIYVLFMLLDSSINITAFLILILFLFSFLLVLNFFLFKKCIRKSFSDNIFVCVFCVILLSIFFVSLFYPKFSNFSSNFASNPLMSISISYGSFYICVFIALYYFVKYLIRSKYRLINNNYDFNIISISCFSAMVLYVHSMSGTMEIHGSLLALSLVLCIIFQDIFKRINSRLIKFNYYNIFCLSFIIVMCIVSCFTQRIYKPYHWWGVGASPSITEQTSYLKDPTLKGFKIEKKQADELNYIYDLVINLKNENDTMYTFASINYFNVMSGLKSPTFAKVHFFDVCTDEYAISDLKIIQETEPNFIVYIDYDENTYITHEKLYRNDNYCGQRVLIDGIKKLCDSEKYELIYISKNISEDPIYFYHKL